MKLQVISLIFGIFQEILAQEKTKGAETIEGIKREHETNTNDIITRHEAELQVYFNLN